MSSIETKWLSSGDGEIFASNTSRSKREARLVYGFLICLKRKELKITREQLSEIAGVSYKDILWIESAKGEPETETILNVYSALISYKNGEV